MDTSKMKNSMASFRNKMNSSRGSGSSFGAINGSSENASQSTASPSEEAGVMPAEDETTQSPAQSTPASPRNQPGGRKPKLDIKEIDRITGGIVDEVCTNKNTLCIMMIPSRDLRPTYSSLVVQMCTFQF
jgi:hypothetical protein